MYQAEQQSHKKETKEKFTSYQKLEGAQIIFVMVSLTKDNTKCVFKGEKLKCLCLQ